MKHTATQALVTIAIALAIVVIIKAIQARAAGDNLHSEVIGTWCSETRAGPSGPDNREWYIRGGDCESFNRLVVTGAKLRGHEFECRITSVKLAVDGDYPNAASTKMGATINQFTADCEEAGCGHYSAHGTVFVSKRMLGLRLYDVRNEPGRSPKEC
jgi:hypothetical protein